MLTTKQGDMAANKELPQTSPTTLCHSNTAHGANILRGIVGKRHVTQGCLLP